jgi:hypothetical protein
VSPNQATDGIEGELAELSEKADQDLSGTMNISHSSNLSEYNSLLLAAGLLTDVVGFGFQYTLLFSPYCVRLSRYASFISWSAVRIPFGVFICVS